MTKIKSICVYCGSRPGNKNSFTDLAKNTGKILAENNIKLVYGGGNVGLMGVIATSVMDHGGNVHGIIPGHLDKTEKSHDDISKLTIVDNMHQRKRMMFDHSDAFLVLPGSIGTLDETIEAITWAQLKLHDKPIVLLNHEGYWDPFMDLLNNIIKNEFTAPETMNLFHVVDTPEEVLPLLETLPDPVIDPKNTLI
ncbi:TIGR00730 family Rossman fold protein [Pseudemcibacter aquimaris]|uniref:LOG family protein n=1 Tax=Pseudemcibacter aquimaris TaxID=2857064 RepID=UPI0020123523|nr:TIGR00730 family Rossman fold protein [Pseudemcibacter aquimaris]MCC3860836.1 TIGR00730 family Rossman fold protein [Pseudemcibacter aquimaris]WDU59655.1 TIGR00730 family Rossman fold protein [Pseudemcibacter aquimaris]